MKFLKDLKLGGRRILTFMDLNVALDENAQIADDSKLKKAIPTIKQILSEGGRPVLMANLAASSNGHAPHSIKIISTRLRDLLDCEVITAPSCIGTEAQSLSERLAAGQVLLLENLALAHGEESNDPQFCSRLAQLGDIFVGDSFGDAQFVRASTVGTPLLFREKGAGLLIQRELECFQRLMVSPKPPFCIIVGGLKLSSRLNVLAKLIQKAQIFIIGGAASTTFLAAQGLQMGRSKFEHEMFPRALELLGRLARRECKVYLPVDFVVAPALSAKGLARTVTAQEVPPDLMALDIGPASSTLFSEALQSAETIIWIGPMGAMGDSEFSKGTQDMIQSVAGAHAAKVVLGEATEAAIREMQLEHKFELISSGENAFISMLEGKTLPGIGALES